MEQYLAPKESIARNKNIESAVNKFMNQHECEMNETERNAMKSLMTDQNKITDQCSDELSYFKQIQSKQRKLSSPSSS